MIFVKRTARGTVGLVISTACSIFIMVNTAGAFSSGPDDGLTNAPGENNCTMCHDDFALNSGSGTLDLTGLPSTYTPDTIYQFEVSLADPDAMRWGFELTVLDGSDSFTGNLVSPDAQTQISTGGPFNRTYAKHTSQGTQFGQTVGVSWILEWTAPAAGSGDLTFYFTGNGANGDFSNSDDRIYASTFMLPEESTTAVPDLQAVATLHPNFPNPFNPRTVLSFTLTATTAVNLDLYDVRGVRIRSLFSGDLGAGTHTLTWNGADNQGRPQPSGIYLARLVDGNGQLMSPPVKMTLSR